MERVCHLVLDPMSSVFVFVLLGMLPRRPRLANADYLLASAISLLDKKEVIRIITRRSGRT